MGTHHKPISAFFRIQLSHWFTLSAAGAIVLGAWFWLMPRGFPLAHPRTLANVAFPLIGSIACISACVACATRNRLAAPLCSCLPGIGLGLAAGCLALFPRSMLSLKILLLSVVLAYLLIAYVTFWLCGRRVPSRASTGHCIITAGFFITVGGAWALTQRAPSPSTRPLNAAPPPAREIEGDVRPVSIEFRNGKSNLFIQPSLVFRSLSPDGFWTLFAPLGRSWIPPTTYVADRRRLDHITTWCDLESDNFSHLNTFTELEFNADGEISISFSPCPDDRIKVQRAGYPFGKPARFAYLGADGIFRIVEASSAEKGPFTVLASGACPADHALELTLYSRDTPAFILQFDDFLAQCSKELSPTAGWRVPQNSIQFALDDEDNTRAFVFLSLASTSVGRGFDSVGHRRGIYRNQMHVRKAAPLSGDPKSAGSPPASTKPNASTPPAPPSP